MTLLRDCGAKGQQHSVSLSAHEAAARHSTPHVAHATRPLEPASLYRTAQHHRGMAALTWGTGTEPSTARSSARHSQLRAWADARGGRKALRSRIARCCAAIS